MRIVCPTCSAAYEVPDGQLSEGRMVRCVRCNTDWAPLEAVPVPVADELELVADEPEAVESPAPAEVPVEAKEMALEDAVPAPTVVQPAPPKRSALLIVAWVLSVAAVGAAGAGLVIGRDRVMAAWPPSIRAYTALGLAGR